MPETKHSGLTILSSSQTRYPETPEAAKLEAFPNSHPERNYRVTFHCPEFTSRCPITDQPDFGTIEIEYVPDSLCLESKALKLYLFAFRNCHTFHEEAVNRMLDDIVQAIQPREATVTGRFNARGGISITVQASYASGETGH